MTLNTSFAAPEAGDFGAGVAAALSIVLVWIWNSFMPTHLVPDNVQLALTTILGFAGAYAFRSRPPTPPTP